MALARARAVSSGSRRGCIPRTRGRSTCRSRAWPTSTIPPPRWQRSPRAFPAAGTTLLHPADAQYFLEVCDRPGKPVPFVPVLDAEVRRWYMADALWQAQDDRLDADAVFVIPGPRSLTGIARVDEPVGELLARFEDEAIARVLAGGAEPARRERLADPGPCRRRSPPRSRPRRAGRRAVRRAVAARRRARRAALAAQPAVAHRRCPATRSARGSTTRATLARIEVLPAGATGERLEIAARGDEVVVTATMPALDGAVGTGSAPPAELVTRWRAAGAGAFVAVDGDAGTVDFARRVLGARAEDVPEHPLDPVAARVVVPGGPRGRPRRGDRRRARRPRRSTSR